MQDHVQKPDTDFEPNLVNTVCFLVQWVVQLTTFGVNYLGHPFNQSLLENKGLALALRWGTIGFITAATNIVPGTDWALSLVRILCHIAIPLSSMNATARLLRFIEVPLTTVYAPWDDLDICKVCPNCVAFAHSAMHLCLADTTDNAALKPDISSLTIAD